MASGQAARRARFTTWFGLVWLLLVAGVGVSLSSGPVLAQEEKAAEEAPAEEAPAEEAAPAADAGDGADEPEKPQKSALKWLLDASGPFGLMIIAGSFLLVGLIMTGILQFRRSTFMPPAFVAEFESKLNNRDLPGAFELAKKDDSILGKLLVGGMSRLNKGYEESAAGIAEVADDENLALDHKLSYISLIGAVAPMLGLLGTVQGMVGAFLVIASSTTSPKPNELAEGIVLALVTTLEGLIVAIPAIIGFGLLKNQQARLMHDSLGMADNFIQRILGKKAAPAAAPAAAAAPAPAAPPSA